MSQDELSEAEERGFRRGFDEGAFLGMIWAILMCLVVIPWIVSVMR